jgi:hypothetical protein
MSNEQAQELFSSIKKLGMKLEFELNELIKKQLNNEEILLSASSNSAVIANLISQCQNMTELLSIPLNFPTKNDVARVAKLAIQVEEKVDKLEEQMLSLSNTLADIKSSLKKLESAGRAEKPASLDLAPPNTGQNPLLEMAASQSQSDMDSEQEAADSPAGKRRRARARAIGILLDNLQKNADLQYGLAVKGTKENGG